MVKGFNKKSICWQNKESGLTLLEVIIATFILLIAVVGSYLAFSRILMVTSSISDRFVAAYLAQEGVEVVRNIRDTNWINSSGWDNILNTCPVNGCELDYRTGTPDSSLVSLYSYSGASLNIDSDGFYTYEDIGTTPTKFKRQIIITPSGDSMLDVVVNILWADKGQEYSLQVEEYLYNWR